MPQQALLNFMMNAKQTAGNAAQEIGGEVEEKLNEAHIPGVSVEQTPVGAVAMT